MAKEKPNGTNSHKMSPAAPTTIHDVPNKLLELIVLHLTSPLCIIRAAATCRRWRRIVRILRSFSHFYRFPTHIAGHHLPPHIAGHYHHPLPQSGGCPTFVPSSPSLAVDHRYFSLDFLPAGGGKSWKLIDSHGSLLLLSKKKSGWMRRCFPDLVVCEPLTRRHHLIPRPPEMRHHECLAVFFSRNCSHMSSFTVTCVLYECRAGVPGGLGTVRACSYGYDSRVRGVPRWGIGKSAATDGLHLHLQGADSLQLVGRAWDTSFWWTKDQRPMRLVCSCGYSTRFSVAFVPEHIQRLCVDPSVFRVVSGIDDKVRITCLEGDNLKVFATPSWFRSISVAQDWIFEKCINLRILTRGLAFRERDDVCFGNSEAPKIVRARGQCVVLTLEEETWLVNIGTGTMEVEKWIRGRKGDVTVYQYELPWQPRFQACPCHCKRQSKGPCSEICTC